MFFLHFRNFGLLSFGEEAEEDEETNVHVQRNAGKAKSLHDVVDSPNLRKEPVKVEKNSFDIKMKFQAMKHQRLKRRKKAKKKIE